MAIQIELLLAGYTDTNGDPLSGGKVFTYIAGTTTDKLTWTDSAETTPATNPIILNSNGRANVYGTGVYKFVIKTSADATLVTYDNISIEPTDGLIENIQNNIYGYAGTSGGSANAQTVALSPVPTAYTDGMEIDFMAGFTNTTAAPTLNVNGLGAITIYSSDGTACGIGYLKANGGYKVRYKGSKFYLIGDILFPNNSGGTSGGSANAQTITLNKTVTAYSDGLEIIFKAGITNTATNPTIAVNGLAATIMLNEEGGVLNINDIPLNGIIKATYFGSNFYIQSGLRKAGTYTPTLTNSTNIAASTAYVCNYSINGNFVTVSGKVDIDVTAASTYTVLLMTLPIASNLTNQEDLAGTATINSTTVNNTLAIGADAGDKAFFAGMCSSIATNVSYFFEFSYRII